jgi:hypothetical protein
MGRHGGWWSRSIGIDLDWGCEALGTRLARTMDSYEGGKVMITLYRVNFGNGQVHYAGSRAECERFARDYGDGFTFVQWQDIQTGDWFKAKYADRFGRR